MGRNFISYRNPFKKLPVKLPFYLKTVTQLQKLSSSQKYNPPLDVNLFLYKTVLSFYEEGMIWKD